MASRLWSEVDRLPLSQVPHWGPGSQSRTLVILSRSLPEAYSLKVHSLGWWGGGHSLGGLFCIFDSAGCPFLKQEEEEQGEEGGDGATGDPKKEKKSLDSEESEDEEDDYQVLRLVGPGT